MIHLVQKPASRSSSHIFPYGLAVSILCSAAPSAHAHHPGGPGGSGAAGPIQTISAETLAKGSGVAGIAIDQQRLDELSDAVLIKAAEDAAAEGEEHSTVHSLSAVRAYSANFAYGITDDLMLSVRLPFILRADIREGEAHEPGEFEAELHGTADGIGDISAIAQWRFLQSGGWQSAVIAGFTAPTGKTNERDLESELFDAEFQPGSGAWQGHFGLALSKRAGAWSFDLSGLYSVVGDGTQNTDLGDRFNFGVAVSHRISGLGGQTGPMFAGVHAHAHGGSTKDHVHNEPPATGPSLDLILEINGEWADKQIEDGEINRDSGGTVLYISPGLRTSMGNVSAFASVGIPIVNELNGIQSEANYRLTGGLAIGF